MKEALISLKLHKNGKITVDYEGHTTDVLNMLATAIDDNPLLGQLFEEALNMVIVKKIEEAIITQRMQKKGKHEKTN